jgi:hypothetical protein
LKAEAIETVWAEPDRKWVGSTTNLPGKPNHRENHHNPTAGELNIRWCGEQRLSSHHHRVSLHRRRRGLDWGKKKAVDLFFLLVRSWSVFFRESLFI